MGSKGGPRQQHRRRPVARALLLLAVALPSAPTASAHPYPADDLHAVGFGYLMARDCATYCGSNNQYCCNWGEECFTTNNIAGCSAADGGGHGVYLTTWTQTQTFTSTVSTSWAPAETTALGANPVTDQDCSPTAATETSCGRVCCADWQYCAYKGQCYSRDGWSVPVSTYTTNGQLTTQFSQAYRITSTATASSGADATGAPADGSQDGRDDGGDNGLSAGAIAGIVIGALAGTALLMLLCFCCVARGLWAMLCGGGRDKDRERDRRGSQSAHSRRDRHRTWFGARVSSRSDRRGDAEKEGGNKFLIALTAIASTLAALLFLKRGKKRQSNPSSSEKTRSTTTGTTRSHRSRPYTDSWTGTESDRTASTAEPSNYTRRTRETRTTRYTHSSRRPRDRDY